MFKRQKLAQIALVGPGIRPQNSQRDDFTREPQCLLQSMFVFFLARKHLSTLYSFRGLPLPTFQLNDASMGASADESSPEKNTYNTMNSQQSNEQHCTNVYMEWPRITLERKFKSSVCQIIIREAITC